MAADVLTDELLARAEQIFRMIRADEAPALTDYDGRGGSAPGFGQGVPRRKRGSG